MAGIASDFSKSELFSAKMRRPRQHMIMSVVNVFTSMKQPLLQLGQGGCLTLLDCIICRSQEGRLHAPLPGTCSGPGSEPLGVLEEIPSRLEGGQKYI